MTIMWLIGIKYLNRLTALIYIRGVTIRVFVLNRSEQGFVLQTEQFIGLIL